MNYQIVFALVICCFYPLPSSIYGHRFGQRIRPPVTPKPLMIVHNYNSTHVESVTSVPVTGVTIGPSIAGTPASRDVLSHHLSPTEPSQRYQIPMASDSIGPPHVQAVHYEIPSEHLNDHQTMAKIIETIRHDNGYQGHIQVTSPMTPVTVAAVTPVSVTSPTGSLPSIVSTTVGYTEEVSVRHGGKESDESNPFFQGIDASKIINPTSDNLSSSDSYAQIHYSPNPGSVSTLPILVYTGSEGAHRKLILVEETSSSHVSSNRQPHSAPILKIVDKPVYRDHNSRVRYVKKRIIPRTSLITSLSNFAGPHFGKREKFVFANAPAATGYEGGGYNPSGGNAVHSPIGDYNPIGDHNPVDEYNPTNGYNELAGDGGYDENYNSNSNDNYNPNYNNNNEGYTENANGGGYESNGGYNENGGGGYGGPGGDNYDNSYDNNNNNNNAYSGIPGTPWVDFPLYSSVPFTGFSCRLTQFPGFYADIDTGCQAWHYCQPDGRHDKFLCPNGTLFNQATRVCDWWYNVDCPSSLWKYNVNGDLYRVNGGYKKVIHLHSEHPSHGKSEFIPHLHPLFLKKQLPPPQPPSTPAVSEHTLTTITPVVIPITSQQQNRVTTSTAPDSIGLYELKERMSKSLHPKHHETNAALDVKKLGHINDDHPIVDPHHGREPVFGERISYRNKMMNTRSKDHGPRASVLQRRGYHHHRLHKMK